MAGFIQAYYRVTKPGIIRGNLITVIAAYMFASKGVYDWGIFLALSLGSGLIIASGCVLNNIFDKDIDSLMPRTKKRELVTNLISTRAAYMYATVLGITGIAILVRWTNTLTVLCGLVGLVFYAFVYTYAKRKTHWSTLIGTVPGATPPVAGYAAVTGKLDTTALLLFLILVCWQMPHFLAIAIRRIEEYKAAHIPLLSIVKGVRHTMHQMHAYIMGFLVATLLLGLHERLGNIYFGVMLAVGLAWLYMSLVKKPGVTDTLWAKRVFLFSLVTLLLFDVMIASVHYLH